MNPINSHATVRVAIYESTLSALVVLKRSPDEPLADVIDRIAGLSRERDRKLTDRVGQSRVPTPKLSYKHEVSFLDINIGANSYGDLYCKLVDTVFEMAPEALTNLSGMKARIRRYVATDRRDIHPTSPHLLTLRTASGWYVSRNIGRRDFVRGVKALCRAARIKYDEDVRLLS